MIHHADDHLDEQKIRSKCNGGFTTAIKYFSHFLVRANTIKSNRTMKTEWKFRSKYKWKYVMVQFLCSQSLSVSANRSRLKIRINWTANTKVHMGSIGSHDMFALNTNTNTIQVWYNTNMYSTNTIQYKYDTIQISKYCTKVYMGSIGSPDMFAPQ